MGGVVVVVAVVGVCGTVCIAVESFAAEGVLFVVFVLNRPVSGSLSLDADRLRSCQRSVRVVDDHVGDGVGVGVGVGGSGMSATHDRGLVLHGANGGSMVVGLVIAGSDLVVLVVVGVVIFVGGCGNRSVFARFGCLGCGGDGFGNVVCASRFFPAGFADGTDVVDRNVVNGGGDRLGRWLSFSLMSSGSCARVSVSGRRCTTGMSGSNSGGGCLAGTEIIFLGLVGRLLVLAGVVLFRDVGDGMTVWMKLS